MHLDRTEPATAALLDALVHHAEVGNDAAVGVLTRLAEVRLQRQVMPTPLTDVERPPGICAVDRRRQAARRLTPMRPGGGLSAHDPWLSKRAA